MNIKIICPICSSMDTGDFSPQSLLFPSISNNEILPKHNNHICNTCGVVFMSPKPSRELLNKYYNDTYRKSEFAFNTDYEVKLGDASRVKRV